MIFYRLLTCIVIYNRSAQRKSCQKFKEMGLSWVCSESYSRCMKFVLVSIRRQASIWIVFRFLRYVCLSACLACVVESQFPLAAVLTLASASDSLVLTVIILLRVFPGNGSIARGSVCCHDF